MTDMRLSGELPFDRVIDESRRVRVTQTFDNVAEAIAHTAEFYRRSALREADDYLEIWLEKDALSGVLWDVTSEYDVPLMVSRGMPSLTFLYASACAIRRAAEKGKGTYIYQFGDHDPSGVLICAHNLVEPLCVAEPYLRAPRTGVVLWKGKARRFQGSAPGQYHV